MKQIVKTLLPLLLWGIVSQATAQIPRMVCDETCLIDHTAPAEATTTVPPQQPTSSTPTPSAKEPTYAVVAPVGHPTVAMVAQGPRLTTLNGKCIALVGGSFMASITHPELKRLILAHYPEARVLLFDEVGAAGVYPAPGITRRAKEEFQEMLQRKKVAAVISGNCGCGLCTPKEVGSCIAAEYLGIPSVAIAAPGFVEQARYTARNNGVLYCAWPNIREPSPPTPPKSCCATPARCCGRASSRR